MGAVRAAVPVLRLLSLLLLLLLDSAGLDTELVADVTLTVAFTSG